MQACTCASCTAEIVDTSSAGMLQFTSSHCLDARDERTPPVLLSYNFRRIISAHKFTQEYIQKRKSDVIISACLPLLHCELHWIINNSAVARPVLLHSCLVLVGEPEGLVMMGLRQTILATALSVAEGHVKTQIVSYGCSLDEETHHIMNATTKQEEVGV